MIIYIKIGTHPATQMHLCRKRKPPVIGELVKVKEENKSWWKPQRVLIDDIRQVHGQTLYFTARF